ncbi:hypothetical protein D1872_309960 [compost metagenome]
MAYGQPDPDHQEPEDVANHPEGPCADVALPRHCLAVDRLLAEREEGKGTDDETGSPPGDPYQGDEAEQPGQPPGQPHKDAPQYKPEQIEQEAEKGHVGLSRLINWQSP